MRKILFILAAAILAVPFLYGVSYSTLNCSLCGKEISGNYVNYPNVGLNVCQQCEQTKPRCEKCNVPLNRQITVGRHSFCERCVSKVDICHSCGEALLGEYSFYENNESLKFCFNCSSKYPHCADCGAPAGPDGVRLNDGRYLCPDCRRIALFDAGMVTPIKKKVVEFTESMMGMQVKHDVSYTLKDRVFLAEKTKGQDADLNGLFYRKGDKFDIYVVYGLREKDLISVIAHEYTHAWEAENCGEKLSLEDEEGFAQWVAYKVLISFAHEDFASLLTEGDNIYARGLTRMIGIEKKNGPKAVFNYITSRR